MHSKKYRIKPGNNIFSKSLGSIDNDNLTDELAEKLLATGSYNNIIELITTAESESAPKKSKKKSENLDTTDNTDGN